MKKFWPARNALALTFGVSALLASFALALAATVQTTVEVPANANLVEAQVLVGDGLLVSWDEEGNDPVDGIGFDIVELQPPLNTRDQASHQIFIRNISDIDLTLVAPCTDAIDNDSGARLGQVHMWNDEQGNEGTCEWNNPWAIGPDEVTRARVNFNVDEGTEVGPGSYSFTIPFGAIGEQDEGDPPQAPPEFLFSFGSEGDGDGEFNNVTKAATDAAGNIYVTSNVDQQVQKFTSDGTYLAKWGTLGAGPGEFSNNSPRGIVVDSDGNIYVADFLNHRIQKFNSSLSYVDEWGTSGVGPGEFNAPHGLAISPANLLIATDRWNHRIQVFTLDGVFVNGWGEPGTGEGQFQSPTGVATDSSGNVYVAESAGNRVQKFTPDGIFIQQWGSAGNGFGRFNGSSDVKIDSMDNVYVLDVQNHRVQKFSTDGEFLTVWGTFGSGEGEFNLPWGMTVGPEDRVIVADSQNRRVQVFAASETP